VVIRDHLWLNSMDQEACTQLTLIDEVTQTLTRAGVPHWLFGGWAVDFIAGEVTRPHRDIEFAVWASDAEHVSALLAPLDYQLDPAHTSVEMTLFWKHEQIVEFYNHLVNAAGQIVIAGKWSDWAWADAAFDAPMATLHGVTCPIVSAQSILATKEGYAAQPHGGPLRDKDIADIARLRKHLGMASTADKHG
jgi:hypothetical protein